MIDWPRSQSYRRAVEGTLLTVDELIAGSGAAFGTSGLRGLATSLTNSIVWGAVTGFLEFLRQEGEFHSGPVAVAGDLRESTPRLLQACARAIRDAGGQPVFCGLIPTPALAYYAFARGIPAIMVTGSHIPAERNGIKFHRSSREILKDDEAAILRQPVPVERFRFTAGETLEAVARHPEADLIADLYVSRYLDFFGSSTLQGLKIGVWQHSAVGRDMLIRTLRELGAVVVPLGRSESFVPVDTEAIPPDLRLQAKAWVKEHRLDAIVSTDGDSDRPMLADQTGEWLRGDTIGLLCARELGAECVVTPISSSTALERSSRFSRIIRTRIGSPYLISAMLAERERRSGIVCGYEANGGFVLGSTIERNGRVLTALLTRDATLPLLSVLTTLRGRTVSELCAELPQRFTYSDRLRDFSNENSLEIVKQLAINAADPQRSPLFKRLYSHCGDLVSVDQTDGVRMTFASGDIIHFRPSGNAPELRCYTESDSSARAEKLNAFALDMARGS